MEPFKFSSESDDKNKFLLHYAECKDKGYASFKAQLSISDVERWIKIDAAFKACIYYLDHKDEIEARKKLKQLAFDGFEEEEITTREEDGSIRKIKRTYNPKYAELYLESLKIQENKDNSLPVPEVNLNIAAAPREFLEGLARATGGDGDVPDKNT